MSQAKLQKTFWRVLPASALFCLFQHSLRADVTATILGIARDSSGSVLPNVKVTVSNVETNLSRSALTDTTGEFRFLSLPVGTYTVQAELSGFQTFVAANIVLTFDQQHRIDATLQVGNLQQRVEVSAAAVQVESNKPWRLSLPYALPSAAPRPMIPANGSMNSGARAATAPTARAGATGRALSTPGGPAPRRSKPFAPSLRKESPPPACRRLRFRTPKPERLRRT